MAQIQNLQNIELLSTKFLRKEEVDPLRIGSFEVTGDVDIGGDLDVTGTTDVDDIDVGGDLDVTGTTTVDDLDVGGDLDVTGSITGISHSDLDDLDADDHDSAANGYVLREADATVEDNHLVIWDGTGGRNIQNSNLYISSDNLHDVNTIYANGNLYASWGGRYTGIGEVSIELGSGGDTGGYSFIDFWAEGDGGDHDARIYVSGGSGAAGSGEGVMAITAKGGIDLRADDDEVEVYGNLEVKSTYDYYHGAYIGYIYHPITAVEILDTSTSTDTSRNQIDVSAYGIPVNAKALNVRITVADSGSEANDCYVVFWDAASGGNSTGTFSAMPVDDRLGRYTAVLNCGSNGDIWWTAQASGASTLDIVVYCTGYWL
jgi:hypothetical protein